MTEGVDHVILSSLLLEKTLGMGKCHIHKPFNYQEYSWIQKHERETALSAL